MIERRAIQQLVPFGFGVSGLENDPVGDVGGVVERDDAREPGVAHAEAEVIGLVPVVGRRREGERAHGREAAVRSSGHPDLCRLEVELLLQEPRAVEQVDDLVATEVAIVEGHERLAEPAAAANRR